MRPILLRLSYLPKTGINSWENVVWMKRVCPKPMPGPLQVHAIFVEPVTVDGPMEWNDGRPGTASIASALLRVGACVLWAKKEDVADLRVQKVYAPPSVPGGVYIGCAPMPGIDDLTHWPSLAGATWGLLPEAVSQGHISGEMEDGR